MKWELLFDGLVIGTKKYEGHTRSAAGKMDKTPIHTPFYSR